MLHWKPLSAKKWALYNSLQAMVVLFLSHPRWFAFVQKHPSAQKPGPPPCYPYRVGKGIEGHLLDLVFILNFLWTWFSALLKSYLYHEGDVELDLVLGDAKQTSISQKYCAAFYYVSVCYRKSCCLIKLEAIGFSVILGTLSLFLQHKPVLTSFFFLFSGGELEIQEHPSQTKALLHPGCYSTLQPPLFSSL